MKGFEIVKLVLDHFPGLPEKLTNLFGKCKTWYYSHGYELKKDNPLSNGNESAVDRVLKMVDQYEAAAPGAGKMLAKLVAHELMHRFDVEEVELSDRELRRNLNAEFFEAVNELDKSNLADKTVLQLGCCESELSDIRTAVDAAISAVRAEKRRKEAGL